MGPASQWRSPCMIRRRAAEKGDQGTPSHVKTPHNSVLGRKAAPSVPHLLSAVVAGDIPEVGRVGKDFVQNIGQARVLDIVDGKPRPAIVDGEVEKGALALAFEKLPAVLV